MSYELLSAGTIGRLNLYIRYLSDLPPEVTDVDPRGIAEALMLDPQLVRSDMKELLSKDRIGYENREALMTSISRYTEPQKVKSVVLVGVGKLGSALMSYAGFTVDGLDILAGFDINEKIIRKGVYGKPVYHIRELNEVCYRLRADVAIITTPGGCAQNVCDQLVSAGITAVWNFTARHLTAPPDILIYNEDLSGTLRALAKHADHQ